MDDCLIIELPEFKPQYKRWKKLGTCDRKE